MRSARVWLSAAVFCLACHLSFGQEVLSAHSGLVHFFEGAVFISDQPLEHKFGDFPAIKEGETLRTAKGRAEILLGPGVFLRVDENTSVRMASNVLANTRVELLDGSIIVDVAEGSAGDNIVVAYKLAEVHFPKSGLFRLDSATGTFQAYSGEAEVKNEERVSTIDNAHLFFFSPNLQTNKLNDGTMDDFYNWAKDRTHVITADNSEAAKSAEDADDLADAQPNVGDAYPSFGFPGSVPVDPGISVSPLPRMGSALYDPYFPFAAGPFAPFAGYQVLVLRPYNYRTLYARDRYRTEPAHWPHHAAPGTWQNGVRSTQWTHRSIYSPYSPSSAMGLTGVRAFPYRSASPVPLTVPRISPVAPRTAAPRFQPHPGYQPHPAVGAHPVGHR